MDARLPLNVGHPRFLVCVGVLALMLLSVIGVFTYYQLYEQRLELAREKEVYLAEQAGRALRIQLQGHVLLARSLAATPIIRAVASDPANEQKRAALEEFLRSNHALRPHFTMMTFVYFAPDPGETLRFTRKGKEYAIPYASSLADSINGLSIGVGGLNFSYIKAIHDGLPSFISEAKPNALPGLPPLFMVSAPVADDTGRTAGLLGFGVKLDYITCHFIDEFHIGATGQMEVLDNRRLIISSNHASHVLNVDYTRIYAPIFKKLEEGKNNFTVTIEGRQLNCTASKITPDSPTANTWWVLFSRESAELHAELQYQLTMLIVVCFSIWLLIVILAAQIKKSHKRDLAQRIRDHDAQQQRRYVKSAPYGIALISAQGEILDINPAAGGIFGYSDAELLQRNIRDLLSPHTGPAHPAPGSFGEGAYAGECRARRRDGRELVLVCDWSDAEEGYILFMRDDTELSRHRRAALDLSRHLADSLENSEKLREEAQLQTAKFSAMIEGMAEGVVFTDAEGRVLEANEWMCRFMRTARSELVGRDLPTLHTGAQLKEAQALLETFRANPDHPPVHFEHRQEGKAFILRLQPVYHNALLQGVLINVVDVTELVEARSRAEESTRAKSDFLARMSHEIRTPMNAVLGMAYLALQHDPPPRHREYLKKIQHAAKGLLVIINDILDFSKIEAGKMDVETIPFRLSEQLAGVRDIVMLKVREKGLDFRITTEPAVPDTLLGDPVRLRQILLNLANNAVKFTEYGGIGLETALAEKGEGAVRLRFTVRDTGIGMETGMLDAVFESFLQADGSITRKYGGTGLGLAICKRLVELMGGVIGAESEPGKGSAFYFELPFGVCASEALESEDACAQTDDSPLPPARVLLVEDNDINREIALELLCGMGLTVDTAVNGLEAVAMIRKIRYALILMDVQMPVMDGFEATRQVRIMPDAETRAVPIIAMTANAGPEDKKRCFAAGMDDHISKPFEVDQLRDLLRCRLSGEPADRASRNLSAE